ncbi:MAG: 4Fe-4S binding protein [Candidatus Fermentibacteraceae bacterium]|nr:4Fe-4S binding protein [Candidatus Fermentibacteraceae bacterium]MBN2609821.1 4Fe-4S binding protein [Candidatus Fermentibacteraceae bacterium]
MTIQKLRQMQQMALDEYGSYSAALMICTGTACVANRSFDLVEEMRRELAERGLSGEFLVVPTGCNGFCAQGPIMVVQPGGVFYEKLTAKDIPEIIETHLQGGEPVERLLHHHEGVAVPRMEDIPFFGKQKLLALRHKGMINPEKIEDYFRLGGYQALHAVLTGMEPEDVIREVIRSGIRGRGGGGFPAGVKWSSCVEAVEKTGQPPYVICNADEGDPGAFMDRSIIEADPHCVIEGMLIGAFAVGAAEGFVYIRKEYPLALKRLMTALDQAREQGLLGGNILETGFDFDITVHRGAGAFVCGESSALMASMSGNPGEPRAKYVRSVERGYRDRPTVLNNVETWANIPLIMEKGAGWFASIGTGDVSGNPWNGSSGTKVFSLVGDISNIGLVEVPMGITLREIIHDIGGGIPDGREFKAVQTGGPSGGVLPADRLDLPVDFDTLAEAGSMMGSGGMVVMDDETCMVQVAKYFVDFLKDESCGKCTPCREGLVALGTVLERIIGGEGRQGDIELMQEYGRSMSESSLCALGQTAANPVLSTIEYFREEYEEHIGKGKCRALKCKALIEYLIIPDNCTGCTLCARNCPVDAITGSPKEPHVIDREKCIRCGVCREVCNYSAVEVR